MCYTLHDIVLCIVYIIYLVNGIWEMLNTRVGK